MKALHISHSDSFGGAARAAYRLHSALCDGGWSSEMLVQRKQSSDASVISPNSYSVKLQSLLRIFIGELVSRLQRDGTPCLHTSSWYPFVDRRCVQQAKGVDIVNLHWFREIPSIATIAKIQKPVVWTLHDMWAFCGAEHITTYDREARWRSGYFKHNVASNTQLLDINRWVWNRKRRHWRKPIHIVTPSKWLAKCVSESALLRNWPTHVIPNVLNTEVFKPVDKAFARHVLGLPGDQKIILSGAVMGGEDPNKGFDLLTDAVNAYFANHNDEYTCVIFGQGQPEKSVPFSLPTRWMGHVNDEWTLVLLYSAADVMVVPSRQENLPQTGTEAQACGCPVVAFNTTGLPDVVEHKNTGYLAHPFVSKDLAGGIQWVLEDEERYNKLCVSARNRAVSLWDSKVVLPQYLELYQQAIEQQRMQTGSS